MSKVVRLYQCKSQLVGRLAMSAEDLMARLEISRATLKRDIAKLRDRPSTASPASAVARRIRIMHSGKRMVQAKAFEAVTAAILHRQRLKIWHGLKKNTAQLVTLFALSNLCMARCKLRGDGGEYACSHGVALKTGENRLKWREEICRNHAGFLGSPTICKLMTRQPFCERVFRPPLKESWSENDIVTDYFFVCYSYITCSDRILPCGFN